MKHLFRFLSYIAKETLKAIGAVIALMVFTGAILGCIWLIGKIVVFFYPSMLYTKEAGCSFGVGVLCIMTFAVISVLTYLIISSVKAIVRLWNKTA